MSREAQSLESVTRRALFLSGSFGKGHDTLAEACAEALAPFGVESKIVDCIALLGRGGPSAAGDWVFRRLLAITPVYDAFHFSQLRGDGPLGRGADRAAVKVMLPLLKEVVDRFQPDLIVSVFATGAAAAVRAKGDRPAVTVVFMTDSFAHRIWVHEGTDLFLVTSKMAAASVCRYWPQAPVDVINAPVRPSFYRAPTQLVARRNLGVPDAAPTVLLMSGAWGVGPLDKVARALAEAGFWVLAVCGTNDRLARRISKVAADHASVLPFGYTDRIPELMAASDVVVTSSGDTCREARVIGRGLILLDVVPGHGRENLMHELELGDAAVCSPTAASVVGTVQRFLVEHGSIPGPGRPTAAAWESEFLGALGRAGVRLGPRTAAPAPAAPARAAPAEPAR